MLKSRTLNFSINLEYECPSLNGGSCIHYPICTCPENFGGKFCEHPAGRLVVYASQGANLRATDWKVYRPNHTCNPYLVITAHDIQGRTATQQTKFLRSTLDPVWNDLTQLTKTTSREF